MGFSTVRNLKVLCEVTDIYIYETFLFIRTLNEPENRLLHKVSLGNRLTNTGFLYETESQRKYIQSSLHIITK